MPLVGAQHGGFLCVLLMQAGWLAATAFIATVAKHCSCDSFVHASRHVVVVSVSNVHTIPCRAVCLGLRVVVYARPLCVL